MTTDIITPKRSFPPIHSTISLTQKIREQQKQKFADSLPALK